MEVLLQMIHLLMVEIKMSNYISGSSPTDILLSSTTVLENVSNSSVVATISAIDNEISDVHTFSLIDSNDSSDDEMQVLLLAELV